MKFLVVYLLVLGSISAELFWRIGVHGSYPFLLSDGYEHLSRPYSINAGLDTGISFPDFSFLSNKLYPDLEFDGNLFYSTGIGILRYTQIGAYPGVRYRIFRSESWAMEWSLSVGMGAIFLRNETFGQSKSSNTLAWGNAMWITYRGYYPDRIHVRISYKEHREISSNPSGYFLVLPGVSFIYESSLF